MAINGTPTFRKDLPMVDTQRRPERHFGTTFDEVALIASEAVIGPASSVDGNLAAFDGTTGQVLEDSGVSTVDAQAAIEYARHFMLFGG